MPGNSSRLFLLILIFVTAILVWREYGKLHADKGRLEIREELGTVELIWHNRIEVPMALRFREAFAAWQGQTKRFVVNLHSNGGALIEGGRVIELIREMQRTHQVDTQVTVGNACLSMCIPIFLTGRERIASAGSTWMFHEPARVDHFDGSRAGQPEFERKYYSNRFFEKYFANSAIDPSWAAELRSGWEGKDIWKTGSELSAEGSNIITRLTP